MGEVWKARDTRLNRIVAIKRLKSEQRDRFELEARAIAALNHPHICQIHDIGPDYLVLEYVEGVPLRGPIEAAEALRIALQIAGALEAAHARGILHRDLKPDNILITQSGAKLLDFGLAKLKTDSDADPSSTLGATLDGTLLGTAAYMAPEQAQGKTVDERSEVFSFGAVLFEMLTGRRAFGGSSLLETLNAVVRCEPASIDSPLASIVKRCMAREPAQRFQSLAEVRSALQQGAVTKATEQTPSIAVLPFANLSADKDNEFFSDGLAEEIINLLAQISGLKVIARTSAFAFRGKEEDIRAIAEALGVTSVLQGSVRRAGSRIRVTVQLINAADGTHLWSERYDREMTDVFAVQDEIAAAVSQALKVKFSPLDVATPRYAPKPAAHEALMKARYFHWKVTAESMDRAKGFYEQAIALDPQYALAHALYSDYLFGRTTMGLSPLREVASLSRSLALKALELDPSLPDAHLPLANLAAVHDYDWSEAARRFALSTPGGSGAPLCHFGYGWAYFFGLGRRSEAAEQIEIAVHGDPLNLAYRTFLAMCLGAMSRYAEAEEAFRQSRELDRNFFWNYLFFADLYAARQQFAEALPLSEEAFSLAPWYAPAVGVYAGALVRMGKPDQGKEIVQRLGSGEVYGTSMGLALFHTCCGGIDRAADWAEKAIEERDSLAATYLQSAIGEPLRASPRWPALRQMMNLPAVALP
ncbi:MAG: protein kinase [Terracidiphilus sp.]